MSNIEEQIKTIYRNEYHRKFFFLMIIVLLFRITSAGFMPITGDEAYFVVWAKTLAGGYYDHPPAVAWMIAPFFSIFGNSEIAVRIASIAFVPVALLMTYELIISLGMGEKRAYYAALIVALHPLLWLSFLITTDTPLYLASIVFGYFFIKYMLNPRLIFGLMMLASMALAIQSKYFAVLLYQAYFVATLLKNSPRLWRIFFVVTAGAALSGGLHLWWNANNCYPTILFNFINRQQVNDHWPDTMISFVLMFLWIFIPVLHKSIRSLFHSAGTESAVNDASQLLLPLWLLPFLLFFLIAFGRLIGLHYVVPLVLFFFIWVGIRASDELIGKVLKLSIASASIHLLVIASLFFLPASLWQSSKIYRGIVTHFHTTEILKQFDSSEDVVAAVNYSIGAVLEFHDTKNRHWAVWGGGSFQARQDDFITDWATYQGKNIQVFSYDPMEPSAFTRYFKQSSNEAFIVKGVTFHRWYGIDFNYELYRQEILLPNLAKNYKRPQWLKSFNCPLEKNYNVTF